MHEKLIATLHPLERKVLPALESHSDFDEIIKATGLKDIEVMRAVQWLGNKEAVELKEDVKEMVDLDENGREYRDKKLPERRFLIALKDGPLSMDDLQKKADLNREEINVCIGTLKKKAAIDVRKDGDLVFSITEPGRKMLDKESLEELFLKKDFPLDKTTLAPEEAFAFDNLMKRKSIITSDLVKTKTITLTRLGSEILKTGLGESDMIDRITPKLLKTKEWKGKGFRHYDVKINVPKVNRGRRHFVNQAIQYIKRIWLDLGFKEMQGNMLHTSFWDLDTLFVPQDHPARAMQDTFYIKDPSSGILPRDLMEKVKATHENGWTTGSKGWGGKWSEEMAKKNLLRTHTTVLSAEAISRLKKEDLPAKFFSVGKVFRNEALDWKHLFELHQVEGIVVDPNANFKHLKGYLKEFYRKMGYKDVRMRPAHFPYTEPSVEVDVLHPTKNVWIELGGAGIFRPEVVKPLLGFDCPVLAWGQGMERIIMEYFAITDIRDLYKNDLKQIREMKKWMRS
ncbi:phenylalanine--tRNA ligase subunit alpha [Candidatus Woesearchaeota archaeon CG08_land_8_20_14_0_20_43_7]|nr:MAG: phenylalanine--tRNA ligase subunit alpha [Candidatus Woesearchaeota archaeon CG08_land_8_20_14_0_20_43_7]